jgi:hypothetical protein
MPKNWSVGEPESVDDYLEENNDEIQVGDTIEYISNNQMGYVKYEVILGDDGKKSLKKIADYDSMMEEMENGEDEEEQKGGKRRRRKTMKKTRRHKKSKHHKKTRRHRSRKHRRH